MRSETIAPEAIELARAIARELGQEIAESIRAILAAPAPGLLQIEELAIALRISRKTIAKLARDGLPKHRIGGVTRYDLDEVKAWLKARAPVEKSTAEQPPRRLGRRGR